MAEKTIKQKIELTGEKQYNQAIKDAQRNLKLLQSQLKAETAEMGRNASEQDKAKAKAKSLQEQIAEQEKVVETLREALERAREEYGDNEEVVARWEMKLNSARTTLGNMRSDLDGLDGTLGGAGDALGDMGDKADQGVTAVHHLSEALANIGDTSSGIADTMQGIFGTMVDTVRDAAMSVWGEITSLAGRVNGWADLAGYWNTSTTEIQKWSNAVEASHNSFSDLENAVTRINMGDQKKIAEYAGVSREGYEDEWQYAMAVMDSLAKMDFTKQQEALGAIFGEKRAMGVKDLLNDWQTIKALTDRFDAENGGVGMSEEQMSDLATLAERVDTINKTWQAFKDSFIGEHMAKLSLDLTGNVQGALDALISFMDADTEEEREKALEDFTKNVEAFFTRLGEAIQAAAEGIGAAGEQMQGSENGIVKALGDMLVALKEAVEWFSDEGHIDMVVKGFEALVAFWATARVVGILGKVSSFAADLAAIKAFGTGGGTILAGGAGAGAAGAGAGAAGGGLAAAITKIVTSTAAQVAAGVAAGVAVLTQGLWDDKYSGNDDVTDKDGNLTETAKESGFWKDENGVVHAPYENGTRGNVYDTETGEWREMTDEEWDAQERKRMQEKVARDQDQAVAEGRGTDWKGTGEVSYVDRHARQGHLPDVEELKAQNRAQAEAAIQDWWDAWRAWDKDPEGEGNELEYNNAEAWAQEVMGDAWGDVWYRIIEELDKKPKNANLEDVPVGWYKDILDNMGGSGEKSGLTSEDISGFKSLPEQMQKAAENGARAGISGATVEMDKYAVGRIVAPVVSEEIGGMIVMRQ